ncbi:MAG: PAS domain S-box protein [Spirochaetales bacterium]|nr:PAS domain S-box protein [Spirochaetales bacterium]
MKPDKEKEKSPNRIFGMSTDAQDQFEMSFDWLFSVFSLFIILGTFIATLRIIEHGFSFNYIIQWVSVSVILFSMIVKRKMTFKTRLFILWAAGILFASSGLYAFGLLGQGIPVMLFSIAIAAVGGGKKHAVISIILCTILIIGAALGFMTGILPLQVNPGAYTLSVSGWITAVITFIILGAAISSFLIRFNTAWFTAVRTFRDSEKHYRDIFNATNEAVFIHDADTGKILDVNRTMLSMYGYVYEEIPGLSIGDLSSGEGEYTREHAVQKIKDTIGRGSVVFEWQSRKKDNTNFWTEVSLKRSQISGKRRVIATIRDITERKRSEGEKEKLEMQLRQAQKMEVIGRLAGGVAHDFNNLLQVIRTYSELLMVSLEHGQQEYGFVEEIAGAAERATHLVSQLLAFSRRQILQPANHNLNRLTNDLLKMLKRLLGEHIMIEVKADEDLEDVYADQQMMEQIIINLCVNARDAMPDGGIIAIETANVELTASDIKPDETIKPGNYILLAITDNGAGMDTETLHHIFEPFFTTKDQTKGTGLGLSTVYGIVRQHNGLIRVSSEPEKGTTFRIYLPVSEIKETMADDQKEDKATGGHETILLAEDEDEVRTLIRYVLEGAGYRVITAQNGEEMLEIFMKNRNEIDLMLMDVVMPKIGGYMVYDRLKHIHAGIPAVFLSGYSENGIQMPITPEEGLSLIQKPFKTETLLRVIRKVLDKKGRV